MTSPIATASSPRPHVVRLSGPQGIVAAIPPCLGFTPSDSIVVLGMTGPRDRVGPVARVDLFPPGATAPAEDLASFALRYADRVAVVCYHSGGRPQCLDDVLLALDGADVPIMTVLSVEAGRIRPAASEEEYENDTGIVLRGDDDPQTQALTAATVMSGRRVLGSRADLADSVAGPTGSARRRARVAIARAHEALPVLPERRDQAPGAELQRFVNRSLNDAYRQHRTTGDVELDTASRLIAASACIGCRDHMLFYATSHEDSNVVGMLVAVAHQCPDDHAAEWCSVLAAAAYRFGDGALAHCALDRTFAANSDHRLGHLLLSGITGGLPPEALASLGSNPDDDGRRGTAEEVASSQDNDPLDDDDDD